MKKSGEVRKIDELGRIVLPKTVRQTLNVNTGDAMEIYTEGNTVVLLPYQKACIFCGSIDDIEDFKEKPVCVKCRMELGK